MTRPMSARNLAEASKLSSDQFDDQSSARGASDAAYFFDGHTALKHPVTVTFHTAHFTITLLDGGAPVECPYTLSRRIQPFLPAEHVALRPNNHSGARLVLVEPTLIDRLRRHAPEVLDPPFLRRSRLRRWAAITGTLVAVMAVIFVLVPAVSSVFGFLVPDTTKRAVGARTVQQIFEPAGLCIAEAGTQALKGLVDQLASTVGVDEDIAIHVTQFPMVNAFALPGWHMVLTEKLIETAESSAEVAGIIAHELGHMKLNHPTEAYFRRGLLSAVVDAIFGGGLGFESVAALVITFSYSRDDEAAADDIAINALNDAGITTQGIADFFNREAKLPEGLQKMMVNLEWLSTHPSNQGRRQIALEQGTGRNQALSPEGWRALRKVCAK
jgi:Zn-dependent protease with chaperone function